MAKLCQRQADGFARHTDGLRQLVMRDSQHDTLIGWGRGSRVAEANQRLNQTIVAIPENQIGCIVMRGLHLGGELPAEFKCGFRLSAYRFINPISTDL